MTDQRRNQDLALVHNFIIFNQYSIRCKFSTNDATKLKLFVMFDAFMYIL